MKRFILLAAVSLALSSSAAVVVKSESQWHKYQTDDCFTAPTILYVSNYENDFDFPVAVLEPSITIDNVKVFYRVSKIRYESPAIAKRIYLLNRNIKIC